MKILTMIVSLAVLGVASCNTTKSPEELMDKAADQMMAGYNELDKMDEEILADKDKSAEKHLNKALKHFDEATVYLAQAELPADDQPAVSELKSGLDALEESVKALESDDIDKAQKYYAEAQKHFAGARGMLGNT